MKIPIDEIIENLLAIRNKLCSRKYETESTLTFDGAISIIRKYKTIKEAYKQYQNDVVTNIYADRKFVAALERIFENDNSGKEQ